MEGGSYAGGLEEPGTPWRRKTESSKTNQKGVEHQGASPTETNRDGLVYLEMQNVSQKWSSKTSFRRSLWAKAVETLYMSGLPCELNIRSQ